MENQEIMMNEEVIEMNDVTEEVNEKSGVGFGTAALIGSGVTLAVVAGVSKLRKVWKNRKASKTSGSQVETEIVDD